MSGVRAVAQTAAITTGTSVKTLLQLVAAANHRVRVAEISVSFAGVAPTAAPILVEVLRQTDAGTMSSLTPAKLDASADETLQTTAQHTATVEPSAGTVLFREHVHPQSGWSWTARFGEELLVAGGARLGLRVTAAVAVDAVVRMVYEE